MSGPCEGITVLDFSWGMPGSVATMVLADYGAEVIKIEPPEGDPTRRAPAFLRWGRGKKSLVLDLKSPEGRRQVQRLGEMADVVMESFRPGVAKRLGIDYHTIAEINPSIVYCSISGFGQKGPYSGIKGYEGVVAAKSGRMGVFTGQVRRDGPVYAAVPTASHASGLAAVQGILAALMVREHTGHGQWVQTSLLQGLTPYDFNGLNLRQMNRKDPERFPIDPFALPNRLPTLQYLPARTKDGCWIQLANNMPRLFQSFIRAIGMWGIYQDPRFKNAPDLTEENREILRGMLLEKIGERTLEEWMALFIEDGDVAAEPFMTTQQGIDHTQMAHKGHVVEMEDPRVGKMRCLGLLLDMAETPGAIGGPAPELGQHTTEVLLQANGSRPQAPNRIEAWLPKHPLEGITVLEFATIIAGPLSAVLMADMGARVIKVEPVEGGDPIRGLGGRTGIGALKTIAGKESVQIDLKTPEGQEIVHKLISRADVLLHNYRPGVPERLGIDYETASAINPRLVYLYAGAYGSTGPHSRRPGFHPIPGAVAGGALLQAGRGMPPPPETPMTMQEIKEVSRYLGRANEGNPDPNSSMGIATGMMLGLYARERTGKGQYLEITMLCCNAYANSDDFLQYEGKPERPAPDSQIYGLTALYRLYRAKESWVFLACPMEKEWPLLCKAIDREDLLKDDRFCAPEARRLNDASLGEQLSDVFAKKPAAEWEGLLLGQDIACVQADAHDIGEFFETDPHVLENGFVAEVEHVKWGKLLRHAGLLRFSEMDGRFGPAPVAGQHTQAILTELGYSEEQVWELRARDLVAWEEY